MTEKDVLEFGKSARGKVEILKYLKGERLTKNQAILAKCYDCMCGYADGVGDCETKSCPLYGYMPYNKNKYPPATTMSEEQKEASRKRLANMQAEKRKSRL